MQPLLFPCLIAIGNRSLLLATKKEALEFVIRAYCEDGRVLIKRAASSRLMTNFFIERTGLFREVRVVGLRRRWAKPFGWLFDVVLAECELSPGVPLTNGDLLGKIRRFGGHASGSVMSIRRFLGRPKPRDQVFDEAAFREYVERYGPALDPDEWEQQLP